MPIIEIVNSPSLYGKKVDKTLSVLKRFLRTNYVESNFEEHIEMKTQ